MKFSAMLPLIASATLSAASYAEHTSPCSVKMFNKVANHFADSVGVLSTDVSYVRLTMGAWTEKVGFNTGSAEVAVNYGKHVGYYNVYAEQIGTSDDCEILRVEKLHISSVESQVLESDSLKVAIGDAMYYSEGDSKWYTYSSKEAVSSKLAESEIRDALVAGDEPIETYTQAEVLSFLDGNIESEVGSEFSYQYKALKNLLTKNYTLIRGYKVGVPDSGELKFFIVARSKTGHLVGLYTYSVET